MTDIEKLSPELVKLNTILAKNEADSKARKVRYEQNHGPGVTSILALDPVTLLNALPDNGDGQTNTLPFSALPTGVAVQVAEWPGMIAGDYRVEFRLDDGDFGHPVIVQMGFGTVDVTIPLGELAYDHGLHEISYRTVYVDDENSQLGLPAFFYVDIFDPNTNRQPDAPLLPTDLPNGDQISADYLDTHGGLTFTLPPMSEHKPGDTYRFYIGSDEILTDEPLVDPFEVVVPRVHFDNQPEGQLAFTYTLIDRAGNRTNQALLEHAWLIKTPAPVLSAPIIPEGPQISLGDARDGVVVFDDYQTGRSEDFISFYWNGVQQDAYEYPQNNMTVSFMDIFRPGLEYTGDVTYEVNRIGARYMSPPTTITVDLTYVGPDNPDEPEVVNPDLDPLTLESSTGLADEIASPDKDADAEITVTLYTPVNTEEMIEIFYGGTSVGVHELDAADLVAGEITMSLPWALIEEKGNGQIPAFYRIYLEAKPENAQQSPTTPITVSVHNLDDLPVVVFSNRVVNVDIINCNVEAWINGVHVQMTYPGFEAGDILTIDWVQDSTYPVLGDPVIPSTPVEATRREFPHQVTVTEAAAGVVTFKVPWGDHMTPVSRGSVVVFWKLDRDGGTVSGTSAPHYVRFSRERPGGRLCPEED